ncbi:MAG: TOBE domain-containing protein, partial [Cyanobacteriota bacterium]|nr:TOBE domain-containing protein [Cyanobacteriota bacterium]
MQTGRIVQNGTPRDVDDHPASPWVARFFRRTSLLEDPHRGDLRMLRPEQMRLRADSPDDGEEGRLVQVGAIVFQGDALQVSLRKGAGQDLSLRVMRTAPAAEVRTGHRLSVVYSPTADHRWPPLAQLKPRSCSDKAPSLLSGPSVSSLLLIPGLGWLLWSVLPMVQVLPVSLPIWCSPSPGPPCCRNQVLLVGVTALAYGLVFTFRPRPPTADSQPRPQPDNKKATLSGGFFVWKVLPGIELFSQGA